MTLGIVEITASYVVLALLLLSINLVSLWHWWVKAAATVVTTGFFAGAYLAINSMLGWPATVSPPQRFQLLWSVVSEPDKSTHSGGAIYLWLQEINAENVPVSKPRSFQFPYDDALASRVSDAQAKLDDGEEVMGTVDVDDADLVDMKKDLKIGKIDENAQQTSKADTVPFSKDSSGMRFEDLPPVELPDKGPI